MLHKSRYGYDVYCPALPGCVSQRDTEEEALENIRDAIKVSLETVEEGQKRKLGKNRKLKQVEVAL